MVPFKKMSPSWPYDILTWQIYVLYLCCVYRDTGLWVSPEDWLWYSQDLHHTTGYQNSGGCVNLRFAVNLHWMRRNFMSLSCVHLPVCKELISWREWITNQVEIHEHAGHAENIFTLLGVWLQIFVLWLCVAHVNIFSSLLVKILSRILCWRQAVAVKDEVASIINR